MQTLNEDIKTRQFKPAYLLFGEEAFLKQSYKRKLREAITGGDTMNYHSFQGKGLDVKEIISLGDTMPFFSEKRLILIEDSGFFTAASLPPGCRPCPGRPAFYLWRRRWISAVSFISG